MDIKTENPCDTHGRVWEVIQECSKILRFGNDADKLHKELGDLFCMIKLTEDNLNLNFNKTFEYSTNKYNKLKRWSNLVGGSKAEKNLAKGYEEIGLIGIMEMVVNSMNEGTSLIVSIVLLIGATFFINAIVWGLL